MKPKNVVVNTTEEVRANPLTGLFRYGPHGGIEASEAAGQEQLVNSDVLPKEMTAKVREAFERSGVVFGEPVDGDALFVHAVLPKGWKKRASHHAMWSELIDEKGRKRGSIFYKAAFYDRRATLYVETRFRIEHDYPEHGTIGEGMHGCRVLDGEKVLFDSGWMKSGWREENGKREFRDDAQDAAVAWLNSNKPGWEDPAKYWDEGT